MDTTDNTGRRALVLGLGSSGIATALRLRQIGWTPVIVERAAAGAPPDTSSRCSAQDGPPPHAWESWTG
ncbi:hypothetical protein ABZ897_56890 [Nonomuraea sp. NPDC046802]|uniref:hypothetical protein n=1 Tax=Nonomuraea sp. NPDC046802 TaxID=3154919 RepID=UPI0033F719F0